MIKCLVKNLIIFVKYSEFLLYIKSKPIKSKNHGIMHMKIYKISEQTFSFIDIIYTFKKDL